MQLLSRIASALASRWITAALMGILAAAMAVITGVTVLLYALYWYVGGFYAGPRYWFMALVPMLVFSALGIREFVNVKSVYVA